MARKTYAFRSTELEENFLKQEVKKNNISPSNVIKKLIRDAVEENKKLEEIKDIKEVINVQGNAICEQLELIASNVIVISKSMKQKAQEGLKPRIKMDIKKIMRVKNRNK